MRNSMISEKAHYLCEDGIEKCILQEHHLNSLFKPCKTVILGMKFSFLPTPMMESYILAPDIPFHTYESCKAGPVTSLL